MSFGRYLYDKNHKKYGKNWEKHTYVDVLMIVLIFAIESVFMMLYETKWSKYVNKYYVVIVVLFIIRLILYFIVGEGVHKIIKRLTKQDEVYERKKDYEYVREVYRGKKWVTNKIAIKEDFYSRAKMYVKYNVIICPKIRQQLYDLRKDDFLNLNGRKLRLLQAYDKESDRIKALERVETKDNNIEIEEVCLKAEEVFEQLGITKEMTSLKFYADRLKTLENEQEIVLPDKKIDNINQLFKCYCPFSYNNFKKNIFIDNLNKKGIEISQNEIVDAFEYFDTKVNPFIYNLCFCYIAIHEYDDLIWDANGEDVYKKQKMRERGVHELYRICKKKLPWIQPVTFEIYYMRIYKEKKLLCISEPNWIFDVGKI